MARLHVILCVVITCFIVYSSSGGQLFNQKYKIEWGNSHVGFLHGGTEVQIKIEQKSGGGGIKSNYEYSYGYFQTSLEIPRAQAIVATYYLSSASSDGDHDELDFEIFLGKSKKTPYILHTNIFTQDSGHRERQYNLWFDPTSGFHSYGIFWNSYLVAFYVDGKAVRVLKNMEKINPKYRNVYKYPKGPMYSYASLWNGSEWLGKTDWRYAPFYANYTGLVFNGCNSKTCGWDGEGKVDLSAEEWRTIRYIKKHGLMTYDYCKDFPNNSPECKYGW